MPIAQWCEFHFRCCQPVQADSRCEERADTSIRFARDSLPLWGWRRIAYLQCTRRRTQRLRANMLSADSPITPSCNDVSNPAKRRSTWRLVCRRRMGVVCSAATRLFLHVSSRWTQNFKNEEAPVHRTRFAPSINESSLSIPPASRIDATPSASCFARSSNTRAEWKTTTSSREPSNDTSDGMAPASRIAPVAIGSEAVRSNRIRAAV